jgi:tetratricopeptide (TPR) repeat protein
MKRHLSFVAALGMCFFAPITAAYAQVRADTGSIAIGGSVTSSTVIIGIPQEKVDELVRDAKRPLEELTTQQKENIALLKEKLDLNERQVRAALGILGENDIAPERLAAKLVEIARRFKAFLEAVLAQPGGDPTITTLNTVAQAYIEAGALSKADAVLAEAEAEDLGPTRLQGSPPPGRHPRSLDRLAAAETSARRGDIALIRLRYREAATHFANAAAVFPPKSVNEDKRKGYLGREANALYLQGSEYGDNAALRSAIEWSRRLIELNPRERVPLDWATTQNNLGTALVTLGERESGTARLEEAVAAYRDALKERTRERVPLQWAASFGNQGVALMLLAERRGDAAIAETAFSQINAAFETMRDGGHAPNAAYYEQQLPRARALVARLRGQ